jgi:hypothetical protein
MRNARSACARSRPDGDQGWRHRNGSGPFGGRLCKRLSRPWLDHPAGRRAGSDGLRNANGGQPTQDGFSYLARALLRSDVFHNAGAPTSDNRYNVATGHSYYNTLDYNIAATSCRAIIDELATLAVGGVVHPYLTGTVPLECKGWLTSDVQTGSYMIDTAEEKVLLPFVEAGAEACRTARTQSGPFPLALKAKA